MTFNSEQKAVELLCRNISKCRYEDLEELAPRYLNCTLSYLTEELVKRRLLPSVGNIALQTAVYVKDEKLTCNEVVTIAVMFDLENMARHGQRNIQWRAQKFVRGKQNSCQLSRVSSSDLCMALRQSIKSNKEEEAKILMKQIDELIWIAVLYRGPKDAPALTAPIYLVVSHDQRYVFWQKEIPIRLKEALLKAVECRAIKQLKLTGSDVRSLLLMLRGRESNQRQQPDSTSGTSLGDGQPDSENDMGVNFNVRQARHIAPPLSISNYTIQAMQKRWMGDDVAELRLVELACEVTFSGDVPAILARLPVCAICPPQPLPAYITDFPRIGKSTVVTALRH